MWLACVAFLPSRAWEGKNCEEMGWWDGHASSALCMAGVVQNGGRSANQFMRGARDETRRTQNSLARQECVDSFGLAIVSVS